MGEKSPKPIRDPAAPRLHGFSFTAMATAPASPKKEFVVWRVQVIVHKLKKKQKDLKRKQVIVLKLKKKQKDLKQLENQLKNEVASLKRKLLHDVFHE